MDQAFNYEILAALRNLDRRTPSYLRSEAFAHGSLDTRRDAMEVLSDLTGGALLSIAALKTRISLIPDA